MSDLSVPSLISGLSVPSVPCPGYPVCLECPMCPGYPVCLVCSVCPGCPVCPDDHDDQVGGCTEGSWRLSDRMHIAASIALNDESWVSQSVRYVGIELLGQLKNCMMYAIFQISIKHHVAYSYLPFLKSQVHLLFVAPLFCYSGSKCQTVLSSLSCLFYSFLLQTRLF